jgi:hypothetical protein
VRRWWSSWLSARSCLSGRAGIPLAPLREFGRQRSGLLRRLAWMQGNVQDDERDGVAILQYSTCESASMTCSTTRSSVSQAGSQSEHHRRRRSVVPAGSSPTTFDHRSTTWHSKYCTALHCNASIQLPVHARLNSTTRQFHGACERQLCRPGARHTPLCRTLLLL